MPGFSKEDSRKGGRASAEVRRRKRDVRADILAREKFEAAAADMAGILIKAAKGQDEFAKLDPKDRANFAQKVLEYAVGRPRQVEPAAPESVPDKGLSFSV